MVFMAGMGVEDLRAVDSIDVYKRQQLLLRPDTDGGRGRVAGDPLTLREQLPNGVQDGVKLIRFPD